MRKTLFLILFLSLALSACASADQPAQSVENYYQAILDGDAERAAALSCAEQEANVQMEIDSFLAVDAALDNFSCEQIGTDGDMALVSCTGKIVMSYDGEDQYLDLSVATYQVLEQGGDWLFCGYH